MRVGLDLLYLVPGESGGRESYARELVPAMLERSPELELVVFVNHDAGPALGAELAPNVRTVVLPVTARSRAGWALGELALLPVAARRQRVQLLHSMANFGPASGPFRRLLTIHDLQYQAVPELLSAPARAATHGLISIAARRADRVIAVSAAGREEIRRGLGIAAELIDVVPNGMRPAPSSASKIDERDRHRLGSHPIVLAVATNLPHKNLHTLIDALALIDPHARPTLVFAGHGTDDGTLRSAALAAGVADSVHALGRVTAEQLEDLYAQAACLVLPSLHEGFGLPVLEAMARALPVICSDIPALREVAADATIYVDPHAPEQIAGRITELLADDALAERLRQLGVARANSFSWRAAAEGTLASYERAMRGAS
jgi:glycosyltransferase involved in cell wall biosynthesis